MNDGPKCASDRILQADRKTKRHNVNITWDEEHYEDHAQAKPLKNYVLKPVVKLLPSRVAKGECCTPSKDGTLSKDNTPSKSGKHLKDSTMYTKDPAKITPQFRDITEDDDGYHPYADIPDTRPLFEKDPWD